MLALTFAVLLTYLVARGVARAPAALRMPLVTFNALYALTTVVGAWAVTNETVRLLWLFTLPGLDADWLSPGGSARYWIVLLGPFFVVNIVALSAARFLAPTGRRLAAWADADPSLVTCVLTVVLFCGYCVANLAANGYLSTSLLDADSMGAYRENIQARTQMASTLGQLHFGLLYMAIPAVVIVMLHRAMTTRSIQWWIATLMAAAALTLLFFTTLTKSNVLIFGLAVVMALAALGRIRARGILLAVLGGVLLLTALEFLLSGGSPWAILRTVWNLFFRLASGFPFYMELFPGQLDYLGIDLGLARFGIGPDAAANIVVYNYMFPDDTWVQGAAPAPSHVVAYAQGGLAWSLATMVLVGLWCAVAAALGAAAKSSVGFSLYIGACVGVYYATQTELVGVFDHSYGYKWWVGSVAVLMMLEWFFSRALARSESQQERARLHQREAT